MSERMPLPDFIIGGAPRSGTTFLAEVLAKHPGVFLARPIAPEPKVCLRAHPDGDAGHFADYASFFAGAPSDLVRVEKTTNYFENVEARIRLHRLLPDTKFIFILREPVARAYSNWKWSTKNGLEKLSFAEAVEQEGRRPNPLGPEREAARPFDYMLRARYGSFAKDWYALFPKDRIRFFLFEQVVTDAPRLVRDLQDWMGIDVLPWSQLQTGKINATDDDTRGLDPDLAKRLRALIQPEIETFATMSGVDVGPWKNI